MSKLVTIFGGSGFVGKYIAERMARSGWRVRVAVRRPNEALHVKTYGDVGMVTPVFCNVRDDQSVADALVGADAAINCVGIMNQIGRNKFEAVQHEAAARIARLAKAAKVENLVHISALGADEESESEYARSKAHGEKEVLSYFPNAVVLRPSVIFGSEDGFTNRVGKLSGLGPILPLFGGKTKFQPVFVGDVAKAAELGATGAAAAGVYELGGANVMTFNEITHTLLDMMQKRRLVVNKPFFAGAILATVLDIGSAMTLGLVTNRVLTRDQLKLLKVDNVVAADAKGLSDLGITPVRLTEEAPSWMWRYRPSGQYAAIKNSAKNVKV
ncbi:MAG: complex I NDUFA9 subunit family protein [Halocynthiibacter sp.]